MFFPSVGGNVVETGRVIKNIMLDILHRLWYIYKYMNLLPSADVRGGKNILLRWAYQQGLVSNSGLYLMGPTEHDPFFSLLLIKKAYPASKRRLIMSR
jgi:hypothetical protein